MLFNVINIKHKLLTLWNFNQFDTLLLGKGLFNMSKDIMIEFGLVKCSLRFSRVNKVLEKESPSWLVVVRHQSRPVLVRVVQNLVIN